MEQTNVIMNILFLSVGEFSDIESGSVHIDLVRQLANDGHSVYVACKNERRYGQPTSLKYEFGLNVLRVKTGNIKTSNLIEKGISTILLESQFKRAIDKYWPNVKFDVVLYHTPPITFTKVIKYIKKRDGAKSYLLLKDIFPQNAVDMGMFRPNGLLYKYFRWKEKAMYAVTDKIGCMSDANRKYLLEHNPQIADSRVEISPNSMAIRETRLSQQEKQSILSKYSIPSDKTVFVYGGNLGKPQGVPFIIECLKKCQDIESAIFLIVGNGTDYYLLEQYVQNEHPRNVIVMNGLPKREYESLVSACNVGLVFLDYKFTIPNYPSRILSYLQSAMPVLCVTDTVTDVGKNMVDGSCGWWCPSNDSDEFKRTVLAIIKDDLETKGHNAFVYLKENYDVQIVAERLVESIKKNKYGEK